MSVFTNQRLTTTSFLNGEALFEEKNKKAVDMADPKIASIFAKLEDNKDQFPGFSGIEGIDNSAFYKSKLNPEAKEFVPTNLEMQTSSSNIFEAMNSLSNIPNFLTSSESTSKLIGNCELACSSSTISINLSPSKKASSSSHIVSGVMISGWATCNQNNFKNFEKIKRSKINLESDKNLYCKAKRSKNTENLNLENKMGESSAKTEIFEEKPFEESKESNPLKNEILVESNESINVVFLANEASLTLDINAEETVKLQPDMDIEHTVSSSCEEDEIENEHFKSDDESSSEEECSDDETSSEESSDEGEYENEEIDDDDFICFEAGSQGSGEAASALDISKDSSEISEEQDEDSDSEYDCKDIFSVSLDDGWNMLGGGLNMANLVTGFCQVVAVPVCDEISSEVMAANSKWYNNITGDVTDSCSGCKVTFSDEVEFHDADDWDRKGEWEMHARDRRRFQRRIEETEPTLQKVLTTEHRKNIIEKMENLDKMEEEHYNFSLKTV